MDILSKAKDVVVEYDNLTQEMIHPDNVLNQEKITDLSKKRSALEEDIDSEIGAAEVEINKLKNTSGDKINKIAIETSSELIRQLIGEDVNSSSISAIVEDQLRRNKEKQNVI